MTPAIGDREQERRSPHLSRRAGDTRSALYDAVSATMASQQICNATKPSAHRRKRQLTTRGDAYTRHARPPPRRVAHRTRHHRERLMTWLDTPTDSFVALTDSRSRNNVSKRWS